MMFVFAVRSLVAPFVGAWIETVYSVYLFFLPFVAPFVGAWIETFTDTLPPFVDVVAPFVGAWIETSDTRK